MSGNGAVTGLADCFSVLNSIHDAAEVKFSAEMRGEGAGVFEGPWIQRPIRTWIPESLSGCLPSVFGTLKTIS